MLSALTAPVSRTMMAGGLLLALTCGAYAMRDPHRTITLSLDTVWADNTVYLTAWEDGHDVTVDLPSEELVPFKFVITARMTDGCRWRATETLTPIDDKTFSYSYGEDILSCRPGAHPAIKTPRVGIAHVVDAD